MIEALSGLTISERDKDRGIFWQDITDQYFSSCRTGLELGELVRAPDFSLQDSIAALEIMDPKMDNGVRSLDEVEHKYDCSQSLLPDELIAIIDQLFSMEMSWHSGASLSQTLYTCLYVQEVLGKDIQITGFSRSGSATTASRLLDRVLFPYVVGVIKCCELARNEYIAGYLYEEEDISYTDFGLEFLPYTKIDRVLELLEEGVRWIESETKPGANEQLLQLSTRLRMRSCFLKMLDNIDDFGQSAIFIRDTSIQVGQLQTTDAEFPKLGDVFNTTIQRTLASTTPPRPMMSLSVVDAIKEFKHFCDGLLRLQPLISPAQSSPACMLAFFETFRREVPQACPFVRSRSQSLFLRDKMAQHHANKRSFLVRAIEETCGAQKIFSPKFSKIELPSDARFKLNSMLDELFKRLELPYLDLYKVMSHNPGRQRRNLCKIMADLDVLQVESEAVDQEIALLTGERPRLLCNGQVSLSFVISSWVFTTKLDVSLKILFLGFELDLYKPFEWDMLYWQINNLLQLQCEHLYSIAVDRLDNADPARSYLTQILLFKEAIGSLCLAHVGLLEGLAASGLVPKPNLKFSSEALLYKHRMLPWLSLVSPPALTFEQYMDEKRARPATPMDLFKDAKEQFSEARIKFVQLSKRGPCQMYARIPWLKDSFNEEVRGLIGCCISGNLLVTSLAGQKQDWWKDKAMTWAPSKFSRHFPTIVVQ